MKKIRFFAGLITVLMIFSMSTAALADGRIFVDMTEVISDTPSQIVNSRTMVPVRAISEMIGYDVYWIEENQQVNVCEKGSTYAVIVMTINSTTAYVLKYDETSGSNIMTEATLDSPAILINNRTFVSLRFISEAVGYRVEYDEESRDVYLFSPKYDENPVLTYTVEEFVELYEEEILQGIEEGLAEVAVEADVSISAENNTLIINAILPGINDLDSLSKFMIQQTFDSYEEDLKEMLIPAKQELPALEAVKISVCEEDGDYIGSIDIDLK